MVTSRPSGSLLAGRSLASATRTFHWPWSRDPATSSAVKNLSGISGRRMVSGPRGVVADDRQGAARRHGGGEAPKQRLANGTPHYRSPRYGGCLLALDSYQRPVGEWAAVCRPNMFRSRSGLRRAGGLVTARGA